MCRDCNKYWADMRFVKWVTIVALTFKATTCRPDLNIPFISKIKYCNKVQWMTSKYVHFCTSILTKRKVLFLWEVSELLWIPAETRTVNSDAKSRCRTREISRWPHYFKNFERIIYLIYYFLLRPKLDELKLFEYSASVILSSTY